MATILVIDDETAVLRNVREALEFENFTVIGAENGISGLEALQHECPDLIICDIMMPGMNGFSFLEAVRGNPATAHVPVILITGSRDEGLLHRGKALDATDHLYKPFTLQQLLETVHGALNRPLQE